MEFNITDSDEDNNISFELEVKVDKLAKDDYRSDLFMDIVSTAIMTVGEYIQEMPANDGFKFNEDGVLSVKDTNICLDNFKKEHLSKFIDLLKGRIESLEYSD